MQQPMIMSPRTVSRTAYATTDARAMVLVLALLVPLSARPDLASARRSIPPRPWAMSERTAAASPSVQVHYQSNVLKSF